MVVGLDFARSSSTLLEYGIFLIKVVKWVIPRLQLYHKDTEPLYHSFMYPLVSLVIIGDWVAAACTFLSVCVM